MTRSQAAPQHNDPLHPPQTTPRTQRTQRENWQRSGASGLLALSTHITEWH